jgi:enoyl-CoA hydratase
VLRPDDEAEGSQAVTLERLTLVSDEAGPSERRPPNRVAASPIVYEKDGPIATISLNRPAVLNAYNVAMRDGLFEALEGVRDDPELRVVILRGNGPAFCTGGDVAEFGTAPSPVTARDVRWRRDVWGLLRHLPPVALAAVHGYTVGGGFEMALLSDVCIAADTARFCYPETGLGMIPGVAGTQTTLREGRAGIALDLMLTGRWLNATEALRLGFVARVVPESSLLPAAIGFARNLCELSPGLVRRVKRAVRDGLDMRLAEGLALERRLNWITRE